MDSLESQRSQKLGTAKSRARLAEESRSMKQIENFSPKGLKVLVVDDDPLCLMVLERMLRQCDYNVTTCTRVSEAISMVMEQKDRFDLVMSDVYMPNEDGFHLLEVVGLTLDLPVIMMSGNAETSMVMKGITHGACDYLIKPVRMEELRNIWQHVVRRRGRENLRSEEYCGESDHEYKLTESSESSSRKRKDSDNSEYSNEIIDDISSLKKSRIHWTVQLHQQFVVAVNQLGIDKAVPKRIIEIMGVHGLTRENVASHLQKYRLYLKRLSGSIPEPYPVASFQAAEDGKSGGTMQVQPGGKGLNLGSAVNPKAGFRLGRIDQATLKSLEQYRAYEQRLAANRAQVLGGIGILPSKQSNVGQLTDTKGAGLQRMASVDLSLLWKAQRDDDTSNLIKQQRMGVNDDSATTQTLKASVKVEEDTFSTPIESFSVAKHSTCRHSRARSMSTEHSDTLSSRSLQRSDPSKSLLSQGALLEGSTSNIESTSREMQIDPVDDIFDSFVNDYGLASLETPTEMHPVHQQGFVNAGFHGSQDPLSYAPDDFSGYLLEDILPKSS